MFMRFSWFILLLSTVPVYGHTIVYIFYYWEHEPSLRIPQAILELLPSYILLRNFGVMSMSVFNLMSKLSKVVVPIYTPINNARESLFYPTLPVVI